jgi:MFS family permease
LIAALPLKDVAARQSTAVVQKRATNPYVGIIGVFLGAGLATLNARLVSVGLPDLRGALGLGFDEGSWLPTALNMATMFAGCFVVFFNAIFGPRRILLPAAAIFAVASLVLPLAPGYWPMLALMVIAGLTSGTFYSLTLTFVLNALPKKLIIFGIAAYAADIVFVSNFASAIEGWYVDHLSWHWIFWNAALFTPLMMVCVYFGIPQRPISDPRPSVGDTRLGRRTPGRFISPDPWNDQRVSQFRRAGCSLVNSRKSTSHIAVYPANLCSFSGCVEVCSLGDDFDESVSEAAEKAVRRGVNNGAPEHFQRMLNCME